jgi:hypothetical protein
LKTVLEQKNQRINLSLVVVNMLLTKDVDALVIHIDLKGKTAENEEIMFWSKAKPVKTGTNSYFGLSTELWRTGKHVPYPR